MLGSGYMTGITWTNTPPRKDYEISLEAMRIEGSDFFCGLTFPFGESACSLIVGGWGGSLVGLSSLDYADAANNETTKFMPFENGRWYKIRLRVKSDRITAWVDNKELVNIETTGRKVSIRLECEPSLPLGVATWSTTAAIDKSSCGICRRRSRKPFSQPQPALSQPLSKDRPIRLRFRLRLRRRLSNSGNRPVLHILNERVGF